MGLPEFLRKFRSAKDSTEPTYTVALPKVPKSAESDTEEYTRATTPNGLTKIKRKWITCVVVVVLVVAAVTLAVVAWVHRSSGGKLSSILETAKHVISPENKCFIISYKLNSKRSKNAFLVSNLYCCRLFR